MIREGALDAGPRAAGLTRGPLVRFRVLALTTACLLVVLVFAGLPLQLLAHRARLADVVGTVHGVCYVAYLVAAFQLSRRLRLPLWQLGLVLLAGTVPFCGFVAERRLTHRFEAVAGTGPAAPAAKAERAAGAWRRRWLSRRALLLHLEVAVVAPGCAAAGWWQATRALAGNGLSWFYSVEWPVFALIALYGWWYLIHEDPEVYRARKAKPAPLGPLGPVVAAGSRAARRTVTMPTARLATGLAVLVGLELGLGVATAVLVPFSRPSGWVPHAGQVVYVLHALLGAPLALGAVVLCARVVGASRIARLSGSIGAVGVAIAGLGGLFTGPHPLRFAGMGLMLLGTVVAGLGFLLPSLEAMDA